MLAQEIGAKILPFDEFSQYEPLITQWALNHDIIEVITGDVATPTKRMVGDYDDSGISALYDGLKAQVEGTPVKQIVKLADLIEAVKFLEVEGLGAHAAKVEAGIRENIRAFVYDECQAKWPKYDWLAVFTILRGDVDE